MQPTRLETIFLYLWTQWLLLCCSEESEGTVRETNVTEIIERFNIKICHRFLIVLQKKWCSFLPTFSWKSTVELSLQYLNSTYEECMLFQLEVLLQSSIIRSYSSTSTYKLHKNSTFVSIRHLPFEPVASVPLASVPAEMLSRSGGLGQVRRKSLGESTGLVISIWGRKQTNLFPNPLWDFTGKR